MAYSDFTLETVIDQFNLDVHEIHPIIENQPVTPSNLLVSILERELPWAIAVRDRSGNSLRRNRDLVEVLRRNDYYPFNEPPRRRERQEKNRGVQVGCDNLAKSRFET